MASVNVRIERPFVAYPEGKKTSFRVGDEVTIPWTDAIEWRARGLLTFVDGEFTLTDTAPEPATDIPPKRKRRRKRSVWSPD